MRNLDHRRAHSVKMLVKTFIGLLPLLAMTRAATKPLGLQPLLEGRIVGGVPAAIYANPWQVSLQRSGSHFCGGSLISQTLVVTAAHCLIKDGLTASNLRVRAGSTAKYFGGVLCTVRAFKAHDEYNGSAKANDIGLVRLTNKLRLSRTINTIPLANRTPKDGALATCSGWGTTSYQGTNSARLLYINTNIVGRNECASSRYGYGSKIKETMLCALAKDKDACNGDSGGPLVSSGVLVGIVSWGRQCALTDYPGVYADVAKLRDWIIQTEKTI